MFLNLRVFALCICFFFFGSPVIAANLYHVKEPVNNQPDLVADLDNALRTLLERLTGKENVLDKPEFSQWKENPEKVVNEYSYGESSISVDFDPASIKSGLTKAQLSVKNVVVSKPKQDTLIWWVSNQDSENHLLGDGQANADFLKQAANESKEIVHLPIADINEQLILTPKVLNSEQPEELLKAARRYDSNRLLAVIATETESTWKATWHLWAKNTSSQGSVSGDSQKVLASEVFKAINQVQPASVQVMPSVEKAHFLLKVEGVTIARYAQLQKITRKFNMTLLSSRGKTVAYRAYADLDQVKQVLTDSGFQEVPAESGTSDINNQENTEAVLHFR